MADEKRTILRIALLGAVVILLLWVLSGYVLFSYPDRGTFGDMFGAINSLFSGFAFLGVIIAIILQYQELREQRAEIRQSRLAHEQSASALTSQLQASRLQNKITSINLLLDTEIRTAERFASTRTVQERRRRDTAERRIKLLEEQLETAIQESMDDLNLRSAKNE